MLSPGECLSGSSQRVGLAKTRLSSVFSENLPMEAKTQALAPPLSLMSYLGLRCCSYKTKRGDQFRMLFPEYPAL